MSSTGAAVVARFQRMIERDGGTLRLLSDDGSTIRVGYRPGSAAANCSDGSCVLPDRELEQLMSETVSRHSPGVRVEVEVVE